MIPRARLRRVKHMPDVESGRLESFQRFPGRISGGALRPQTHSSLASPLLRGSTSVGKCWSRCHRRSAAALCFPGGGRSSVAFGLAGSFPLS